MRRTFKIEPTPVTPLIHLDSNSGWLELRGRSLPSSPQRFYTPIIDEIESALRKGAHTLTANFAFEYFNTSSSKCLFQILEKLVNYQSKGKKVVINWLYEECDDDMKETGEDYENILGASFNMIALN